MTEVTVKFRKTSPHAQAPILGTPGAAAFDLVAIKAGTVTLVPETFDTGLQVEIPPGFVMLVFSRSGHGFNFGVRLVNGVGVIDSDYRGNVMVRLMSDVAPMKVKAGDRIAQAMIVPVPAVRWVEDANLSETERGEGGMGSTGA
jgi:dUTP pyrophosphatase